MATSKIHRTDWLCIKCDRVLMNGTKGKADTVTWSEGHKRFLHDGCGGEAITAGTRT